MDRQGMEQAVRAFLQAMDAAGKEIGTELDRTPERVARAWCDDLVAGYASDPLAELSWGDVPEGSGPVLVRRIRFASMCVHHLLPFFGVAHVAYQPRRRLAGLSKIGRVVEAHARRLQTQENLTAAIVATLDEGLQPEGVMAVLEAEHTCMTVRGVRNERSRMTTLASRGHYADDRQARREVLDLLGSVDRAD